MPPRKRAVKKQAPKVIEPETNQEEEWTHIWPRAVVEKHLKRREEAKKVFIEKIEQKKQRMTNNGVPPEKHSI